MIYLKKSQKNISTIYVLGRNKCSTLFLHEETKLQANYSTHLNMGLQAVTVTRQSFSPGQVSKLCRVLGRQLCSIRYTVG